MQKPPAYHYDFLLLGAARWHGRTTRWGRTAGALRAHGRRTAGGMPRAAPRVFAARPGPHALPTTLVGSAAQCAVCCDAALRFTHLPCALPAASAAGLVTLLCGLLGLPPVNGVLPQSPMHTKALAKVAGKRSAAGSQRAQQAGGEPGTPRGGQGAGNGSATSPAAGSLELAGGAGRGIHASPSAQKLLPRTLASSSSSSADLGPAGTGLGPPGPTPIAAGAVLQGRAAAAGAAGPAAEAAAGQAAGQAVHSGDAQEVLPVRVYEQRWSGLLQSLGVAACLAAMPAIRLIPTACLWG